MAGTNFSVRMEGLSEAAKIPGWLEHAQRRMLEDIAEELARAIGEASGSAKIAASFRGHALSSSRAIVESRGTDFAKARDRGAYITPKRGKALRFADGSFHRFARLTPHKYVAKGMRKRRRIGEEAFAKHFSNLKAQG